tara:strand:+ start:190 stop:546 length:357 start_codon:yes stop_codon:yes gene_type:complete
MSFFTRPTVQGKAGLTPLARSQLSRQNDMESFMREGENLHIRRQTSLPSEELRKKDVLHMIRRREEESKKIYKNQKEFDKITKQMKEALTTRSAPSKTGSKTKTKHVRRKSIGGTRKR